MPFNIRDMNLLLYCMKVQCYVPVAQTVKHVCLIPGKSKNL